MITYILLAGYPPFYGESDQEIFASVRNGFFDFPSPEWDNISDDAKDFISKLLQKDPAARMTASESIRHRWFKQGDDEAEDGQGGVSDDGSALVGDDDATKDRLGAQVGTEGLTFACFRWSPSPTLAIVRSHRSVTRPCSSGHRSGLKTCHA